MQDDIRSFGTMKKCPVCGKEYLVPDVASWAYVMWAMKKTGGVKVYFCSWGCLRKWEKEHQPKRKQTYDSPDLEVYAI